jgi:hypothetical protein
MSDSALFVTLLDLYITMFKDNLVPALKNGLYSIHREASRAKDDNKINKAFNDLLLTIKDWNKSKIVEETQRIRKQFAANDDLDELIKTIYMIKVTIMSFSTTIPEKLRLREGQIDGTHFISRCYIECSRELQDSAHLFKINNEGKLNFNNNIVLSNIISNAIDRSIRQLLPISILVETFTKNRLNETILSNSNNNNNNNNKNLSLPVRTGSDLINTHTNSNTHSKSDENIKYVKDTQTQIQTQTQTQTNRNSTQVGTTERNSTIHNSTLYTDDRPNINELSIINDYGMPSMYTYK